MIIAWAAHFAYPTLHGVLNLNDCGALKTACKGSWAITENYAVWPVDGKPGDKVCAYCDTVWQEQLRETIGLHTMVTAAPSSNISRAVQSFILRLETFNKADARGFIRWLGPCSHGASPITRCAEGCAPRGDDG